MQRIRHAVHENPLISGSIADDAIRQALEETGRGWVVEVKEELVAFAIGIASTGNVWAPFVHPDYEGQGFGRSLHDVTTNWLWSEGSDRLWLTTDPGTRAQRFYEKAGWRATGVTSHGELRYELDRDALKL